MNDTLPPSLTQFGAELQTAIARELEVTGPPAPSHRRPPRLGRPGRSRLLVGALTGCAVAGAAVATVTLTSGGGSEDAAWSAHVLRAAEIALPRPEPNTILHVSVTQTMTAGARHDTVDEPPTLDVEGWFQQGGPQRWVVRETVPGGSPVWQDWTTDVYDARDHSLYTFPALPGRHLPYTLTRRGRSRYLLRIDTGRGTRRMTIDGDEAAALRRGADAIMWAEFWNGHVATLQPVIFPTRRTMRTAASAQPQETSLTFSAMLHRLLQSGRARGVGRVTIDGRAAIEIEIPDVWGRVYARYYVDPGTYAPVELDTYNADRPTNDTRLVFHIYQRLALHGHERLLQMPLAPGTTTHDTATEYFRHLPPMPFLW